MEDMEVAEMNLDKDELMRYLNGEIQFTEWKQGHDVSELKSCRSILEITPGTKWQSRCIYFVKLVKHESHVFTNHTI